MESSTPPDELAEGQFIARVIKAAGNNLYSVESPSGATLLVEMPRRFRSTIWIKRGGYVLVDTNAFTDRDNKLAGEIANIVRDEKQWRKRRYWPVELVSQSQAYLEDEEDEDSVVGKMPPSDGSDVSAE